MTTSRLILLEMKHRWLGTLLALLSVGAAVATILAVLGSLHSYNQRTEDLALQRQRDVAVSMEQLQEDFRKLTLKMGFTTAIVHQQQDLADLFAKGYAGTTMPEEWGDRLAAHKPTTINHVLPTLQQRMAWPERPDTLVQLIGVKGEIFIQSKKQVPLLEAVPEGTVVIGQQIQKTQKLEVGNDIVFAGQKLKVSGIRPGRGGADDVGLWIALPLAQQILNKPGQINQIMAVECNCVGDRVAVITREVTRIVPDLQVFEFSDVASFRSDSRKRVAAMADTAAAQEKAAREAGRRERETLTNLLVPIAAAGASLWVGFLLLGNARDRRGEVGILRAIGVRAWQVASMFVGKALVIALAGMAIGVPLGVYLSTYSPRHVGIVAAGAIILALLTALLPAMLAARADPADILRDE